MSASACLQFEEIQQQYNTIKQTVNKLDELLQVLENNDLQQFIKLSLFDIQKQAMLLEDKYITLQFKNETLKYEINKLKQQLPDTINKEEKKSVESAECQVIESENNEILENIDYNSLKIGDDKWCYKIFGLLSSNNIQYKLLRHPAVFTCQEASKFDGLLNGANCKNLFLQDKKKKNFFILSALEKTKFKINELKNKIMSQHNKIKCGKLQFGKEEILNSKLKLIKGSVTPFGILNDETKKTILLIDENLTKHDYVKLHPLVNTMTISLKLVHFMELLEKLNYTFYIVKID